MRLYGLIGKNLGHSWSANYFKRKFKKENITDAKFRMFELEDLSELMPLIQSKPELCGFTVTAPFKQAIIPYLHSISETAQEVGAVNVVKVKRTPSGKIRLHGGNSDYAGFEELIVQHYFELDRPAIVLGNGGAAKAVCYVLMYCGIDYTIVSRTKTANTISYEELTDDMLRQAALIVNATPLGSSPYINECPDINYDCLSERHTLIDLNYNPRITLFMQKGREKGAYAVNGYEMLVKQAEGAWEFWTSKKKTYII